MAAPLCYKLDTDSLAQAQGFRTRGYCLVWIGWAEFFSGFWLRKELKLECEFYKTGQDEKIGKTVWEDERGFRINSGQVDSVSLVSVISTVLAADVAYRTLLKLNTNVHRPGVTQFSYLSTGVYSLSALSKLPRLCILCVINMNILSVIQKYALSLISLLIWSDRLNR